MNGFEIVMACFGGASALINIVLCIKLLSQKSERVSVDGQPLRVQEETHLVSAAHLGLTLKGYASKTDLSETERRLDSKINDTESDSSKRADERTRGLHLRIDGLSNQVHTLIGRFDEWMRRKAE